MAKNRYPGTQPFTAEQKDLFYGRKQETDDLMKLIRFQQMVVLYGKSGLGKSSLLNTKIKQDVETQKISLSMKQVNNKPAEDIDSKVEEADEPVREPLIKAKHTGPLRGGNDRPAGGEKFGLRW